MQEEAFSPEQSIRLIQSMIDKTKNTVADDSYYFLLWGWLVLIACMSQYILKVIVRTPYHPMVWYLMFLGIIFSIIHGFKQNRERKVKTYVEEMLDHLWISIFFSFVMFGFIFARMGWQNCYSFYMLLYAVGSFVTGRTLKFPPLVWGAVGSWLLALLSTFTSFDLNMLLCGAAIIVSYIIPGYLLRNKYRKQL
jgi:hypothetical protein